MMWLALTIAVAALLWLRLRTKRKPDLGSVKVKDEWKTKGGWEQ